MRLRRRSGQGEQSQKTSALTLHAGGTLSVVGESYR